MVRGEFKNGSNHCAKLESSCPRNAGEDRGTRARILLLLLVLHSAHNPDQIPQQLLSQPFLHTGRRHGVRHDLHIRVTRPLRSLGQYCVSSSTAHAPAPITLATSFSCTPAAAKAVALKSSGACIAVICVLCGLLIPTVTICHLACKACSHRPCSGNSNLQMGFTHT